MTDKLAEASSVRALAREDLAAVVAIDALIEGRARRAYVERRLGAALREPDLHAQFAAWRDGRLVGHILARVLEGEFGHTEAGLRLELVGVHAGERGHGVGQQLFEALTTWAQRHGIRQVHTAADWRNGTMLHWLDAMGFELAPSQILGLAVAAGAAEPEPAITLPAGRGPGQEVDFGAPQANDNERFASDSADVRTMSPADLREIVRIDRSITGRDRGGYIERRLAEAMHDSAIRVSLVAQFDGALVGYLMARADLGDFGRTEPVAVVDTIGVDAAYAHQGIGQALLSRLRANLDALRIERIETVVASDDLALLGFFQHAGLRPQQRLPFVRPLPRG